MRWRRIAGLGAPLLFAAVALIDGCRRAPDGPPEAVLTDARTQHAIHDTAFMRAMLPAVERAARAGELKPNDVAMLSDRIEVKAGHGQRYGTQLSNKDGKWLLDPIDDSANVDVRRKALGLMPIAQYVHMVDSVMKMPTK